MKASFRLHNYQKKIVNWAKDKPKIILDLPMGSGKTPICLDILSSFIGKGPVLLLCPPAVIEHWKSHVRSFTSFSDPFVINSKISHKDIPKKGLVISTYHSWCNRAKTSSIPDPEHFFGVVLDEAHQIRNKKTAMHKVLARYCEDIEHKILLTGTPVVNSIKDFYNLLDFLNVDNDEFTDYSSGDEVLSESGKLDYSKYIYHLDKNPQNLPVLEIFRHKVKCTKQFWERYHEYDSHNGLVKIIAQRILSSRCDEKIQLLKYFIGCCTSKKIVITSQFCSTLRKIKGALDDKCLFYHGSLTPKQREKVLNRFRTSDARFLLLSLTAGGTGIDLTCATEMFFMEPYWNTPIERQAIHRIHRPGQTKNCKIHYLSVDGSIETEKMIQMQLKKETEADMI